MKGLVLAGALVVVVANAFVLEDAGSQSKTDYTQSTPALITDVRGAPYKPLDGGYINLRNGRYYVRSGPDLLIDTQTGQGVPIAKPKESH
jgi:hypothetical protein